MNTSYSFISDATEAAETAAKNAIAALKATGRFSADYSDNSYEAMCTSVLARYKHATPIEQRLLVADTILTCARSDASNEVAQMCRCFQHGCPETKQFYLLTALVDSFASSSKAYKQAIGAIYDANYDGEDANEDANEDATEDANEDTNEDANEDATEDANEDAIYDPNADEDLPAEKRPPLRALHQFMRSSGVSRAWYLFERSWFCRSQSLQELAVKVILSGKATEVDVVAPDFREHLEALARE